MFLEVRVILGRESSNGVSVTAVGGSPLVIRHCRGFEEFKVYLRYLALVSEFRRPGERFKQTFGLSWTSE